MHIRTHARTNRRTTEKHTASGSIYWTSRGTKIETTITINKCDNNVTIKYKIQTTLAQLKAISQHSLTLNLYSYTAKIRK